MSRSLLDLYVPMEQRDAEGLIPFSNIPTRAEVLSLLAAKTPIDVIVIGSDLTSSLTAHLLAINGIRVLLVAPGRFNETPGEGVSGFLQLSQSSSWSMLKEVAASARWATATTKYAPHRSRRLRLEGNRGSGRFRRLALSFANRLPLIDDHCLVNEALLGARQEGAFCLNHMQPLFSEIEGASGHHVVGLQCMLSGQEVEVRCGSIVVASNEREPQSRLWKGSTDTRSLKQSEAELHMLLAGSTTSAVRVYRDGGQSAVVVPVNDRLEHVAVSCCRSLADVSPTLRKILFDKREAPQYSWCRATNSLAQSTPFSHKGSVFTLMPVTPWRAAASAERLVQFYCTAAGWPRPEITRFRDLRSPGSVGAVKVIESFRREAAGCGISEATIERCVAWWGRRVRYLDEFPDGLEYISPNILRGEVEMASRADHAQTLEDFCFQSLGLHRSIVSDEDVAALRAVVNSQGQQLPSTSS
jgi:hypothetical protein